MFFKIYTPIVHMNILFNQSPLAEVASLIKWGVSVST